MKNSYNILINGIDPSVSDYFEYPTRSHLPSVAIDWFTDITMLVSTHYGLVKNAFNQLKQNYTTFVLGRPGPQWNSCNFSSLEFQLYLGHKTPFLSSSIMLYHNPVAQWRRSFLVLKAIFLNRYASVFFIGSRRIGSLSEFLNKVNIGSGDRFFQGIDFWYGGFLSNLRNIYSMPHGIVKVKTYSKLKNKASLAFYSKVFRRPSCIIALHYGEGAFHADLESSKYRIPMIALADTDSKPSGFSKAMYIIPTTNVDQNLIVWYLLIFMYILRYVRYTRLCNELHFLNSHMGLIEVDRSVADEDDRIALHTLTVDFKLSHTRTELVNIEKFAVKLKKHKKHIRFQNREFYAMIRIFLEVISIITLALAIKKQGLLNYYYNSIFLFKKKKFTKILVILSYLFERFSKNKNYIEKYTRLVTEKNIVFLDSGFKTSDFTSRKSWLHSYIANFPESKMFLTGQGISFKKKLHNTSFDFNFFRYFKEFKVVFYKKSTQIKKILRKKYFIFQLRKKLKVIQVKQYKTLSGFLAPTQFVNTNIWKRFTVDQLMAKRSNTLFYKKPYIKKNLKFKKKYKIMPVFSKKKIQNKNLLTISNPVSIKRNNSLSKKKTIVRQVQIKETKDFRLKKKKILSLSNIARSIIDKKKKKMILFVRLLRLGRIYKPKYDILVYKNYKPVGRIGVLHPFKNLHCLKSKLKVLRLDLDSIKFWQNRGLHVPYWLSVILDPLFIAQKYHGSKLNGTQITSHQLLSRCGGVTPMIPFNFINGKTHARAVLNAHHILKKKKIKMKPQFLPKSLRIIKHPVNSKLVWDFFRGANVQEKSLLKIRNFKYCSQNFFYKNYTSFKLHYNTLKVGEITGIAICAKSHLYKVSKDWLKAMKTIHLRVFVGILLNKSSNGLVHNILLRCKIAKAFFLMRFNLNAPNVLAFFSRQPTKKCSKHSSMRFRFRKLVARRALHNKYGSYNKK